MGHRIMFDEHDPALARVRGIALELPGAQEKVSHGRPGFFAGKMFAMYGGSTKAEGPMRAVPHCVMVKVDDAERPALHADPRFFYPAYLGPAGWLGLDFTVAAPVWAEVAELLDASYRLVAPRALLRELDSRS